MDTTSDSDSEENDVDENHCCLMAKTSTNITASGTQPHSRTPEPISQTTGNA